VILAFLLLTIVFRSLLIPLVASVMNLLSVAAALGAMNAVLNWGWGSTLLHLSGTGPVDAFLPVLVFSVLFGLSMDDEVYLIGRIQEDWHHTASTSATPAASNHLAITAGQAKSGPVIAAAAGIMIVVFGSFMFGGNRELAEFGFGLGFSVRVDALIIRSLLVPALMHLIGPANWAMPRWLTRILPRMAIETPEPVPAGDLGDGLSPSRALAGGTTKAPSPARPPDRPRTGCGRSPSGAAPAPSRDAHSALTTSGRRTRCPRQPRRACGRRIGGRAGREAMQEMSPLGRLGQPADVADVTAFLV
jgi:hypothetical protein